MSRKQKLYLSFGRNFTIYWSDYFSHGTDLWCASANANVKFLTWLDHIKIIKTILGSLSNANIVLIILMWSDQARNFKFALALAHHESVLWEK